MTDLSVECADKTQAGISPTFSVITSLQEVDESEWDKLVSSQDPFTEHAFLSALECSGSVNTARSGWLSRHIVARDSNQTLIAAVPLYEKYHSYGEYIFDFSWAAAAAQAGLAYFPKLVSAVPFTPVTGNRLLIAPQIPHNEIVPSLLNVIEALRDELNASSTHFLFLTHDEQNALIQGNFDKRISYQFHWENADSWQTFDDYLGCLRSQVRKQVRKERARARAHGLSLVVKQGHELNDQDWHALWDFYSNTVERKGGIAYLQKQFFTLLRNSKLTERIMATLALDGQQPVAGALFFYKGHSLFGRYWGAYRELDALHFELCYYLPMEWAITRGITRFEAGAQGEHKLKRGFLPSLCYSAHAVSHPALRRAISRFLEHESAATLTEMNYLQQSSPFK